MNPESERAMNQEKLMEILVLVKRIGGLFNEVDDLTGQLADAIDRQDEVSIKLVAAMRYDPINKLTIADQALRTHLAELGESEDGIRIRTILNGDESAAQGETEQMLATQAAQNIRNHKRLMEKDRIVNQKITRDKSIYQ